MKKILSVCFLSLLLSELSYSVEFRIDSASGAPTTQVIIPVRVFDFDSIIGIQGTIQFDPTVINYGGVQQFGLPNMSASNIGINQIVNGRLTYLWDDGTLLGVNLADSSVVFEILFNIVGTSGQQSSLCFINSPTPLEVIDVTFNTVAGTYVCGNLQIPGGSNPVANISKTDITCFGADDGTATVSASGGSMPYTYSWSNGATTTSINGLSPGLYSVTVMDAGSASDTASVTINEPAVLSVSASSTDVTGCGLSDGTATVSVSGGTPSYSYSWSNGGTTVTISNLTGGTYGITVSDSKGCTATASTTVTQPSSITVSATSSNVSCSGGSDGSATVTASGGQLPYSYAWSFSDTTATISNVQAGTYSVTVEDANNCAATAMVTITEPAPLNLTTSVTDISCFGADDGDADVTVTGGTPSYSYIWSNNATTSMISGLQDGAYTVTVSDTNNCTATGMVTIIEPVVLVATASSTDVTCAGTDDGNATVTVTGGVAAYSYVWSNGGGTATITNLAAGTYGVTVTDVNNCTATASTTVNGGTPITTSLSSTDVSTNGGSDGSIDLIVTGGAGSYSYLWSNGSTTQDISNLTAGSYYVVVSDASGCTATDSATIDQPVSVGNVIAVQELKIYPNPNDGNFELTLEGNKSATVFEILNPIGQVVFSLDLKSITNSGNRISVTTDLGSGIYLTRLLTEEGLVKTGTLLIGR